MPTAFILYQYIVGLITHKVTTFGAGISLAKLFIKIVEFHIE